MLIILYNTYNKLKGIHFSFVLQQQYYLMVILVAVFITSTGRVNDNLGGNSSNYETDSFSLLTSGKLVFSFI